MVREKVTVSTRTLQWKCVESRTDSKRLYYGRFILSPLMKGQADTIGIAMRRALLGEIEGTCITRVKSQKVLGFSKVFNKSIFKQELSTFVLHFCIL